MIDNEITMDLSAAVAAIQARLRELIGANIALQLNLECEGLWVKADAGRIEQVVVNLTSNARDAMPQGGTITVETSRVCIGPAFVGPKVGIRPKVDYPDALYGGKLLSLPEGNYARLVVSDTGTGMDAATRAMIFMPFWTTKAVGKGVGIGLCVVYKIVNQSGGWLSVESELGRGACFEIYLPEVGNGMRPG